MSSDLSDEEAVKLRNGKILMLSLIGVLTFVSSLFPWLVAKVFKRRAMDVVNLSSALAAGIIFGAFLAHMVPDTGRTFQEYLSTIYDPEDTMVEYPFNTMIIGATFILLLAADKIILAHGISGHGHGDSGHDHVSSAFAQLEATAEAPNESPVPPHPLNAAPSPKASFSSDDEALPVSSKGTGANISSGSSASGGSTSIEMVAVAADEHRAGQHGTENASECTDCAIAAVAAAVLTPSAVPGGDVPSATAGGAAAACPAHLHGGPHGSDGDDKAASISTDSSTTEGSLTDPRASAPSPSSSPLSSVPAGGSAVTALVVKPAKGTKGVAVTASSPTSKGTAATTGSTGAAQTEEEVKLHREAVVRAWVFILALSLHAVFDGMSIGAETTWEGFYAILIAVIAHKVFDGLAAGAAVFPAGFSLTQSLTMIGVCAAMTPLGIAIGMGATGGVDESRTPLVEAIIVSLSAGSFLFISISELLPAALHDGRLVAGKMGAFFAGWLAMIILAGYV